MYPVSGSAGGASRGECRKDCFGSLVGRECAASNGGLLVGRIVVGGGLSVGYAGSLLVCASGYPGKAAGWYFRGFGRELAGCCAAVGFAWKLFRG